MSNSNSALSSLAVLVLAGHILGCGARPTGESPQEQCTDVNDCTQSQGSAGSADDRSSNDAAVGEPSSSNGGDFGSGSSPPAPATAGPHFTGSGNAFRPLTAGCGPETAGQCGGSCEQGDGNTSTTVVRPPATLCFAGQGDPTPEDPSVVIEQVIERSADQAYAHIRVTFDPAFTDNTYGAGSVGWPERRGHRFSDLTKSDHTELQLTTAAGAIAMNFKLDLTSELATADCGFGTGGVLQGDGSMLQGNPSHVLAVSTSLDRNLNGCGYCAVAACGPSGDCTVDSPPTDDDFTPNPETPNWDYRQVYEVWVDLQAFGDAGFGQAFVTYTHSSPAKAQTDTIEVEPTPCPPEWDEPYCPPNVLLEGGNCFGGFPPPSDLETPPPGAEDPPPNGEDPPPNGEDAPPGGDEDPPVEGCPLNEQVFITTEGASICTPIPFTNNPGMDPCPAGYALDLASEGQFCVPL